MLGSAIGGFLGGTRVFLFVLLLMTKHDFAHSPSRDSVSELVCFKRSVWPVSLSFAESGDCGVDGLCARAGLALSSRAQGGDRVGRAG